MCILCTCVLVHCSITTPHRSSKSGTSSSMLSRLLYVHYIDLSTVLVVHHILSKSVITSVITTQEVGSSLKQIYLRLLICIKIGATV